MTVGQKIRFFRDLRGYTQAELGEMVGLPGDRIRQYETNVRTPKPDKLREIADALDVDVAAISYVDNVLISGICGNHHQVRKSIRNNPAVLDIRTSGDRSCGYSFPSWDPLPSLPRLRPDKSC